MGFFSDFANGAKESLARQYFGSQGGQPNLMDDPNTYADAARRMQYYNAYADQQGWDHGSKQYQSGMLDMAAQSGNPFLMRSIYADGNFGGQAFKYAYEGVPSNLPAAIQTEQYLQQNPEFANAYMQRELALRKSSAPSFSMTMPGQESPVMPKDTWDLFEYADGSPIERPPTQAEVAGSSMNGKPLKLKSHMTDDRAKAGLAAATLSQYEKENKEGYAYTPEENNSSNNLKYLGAEALDFVASRAPGLSNYFGKAGQRASERSSSYKYFTEMPARVLSGATVKDNEEESIKAQYLPVHGESPAASKTKEARRYLLRRAMEIKSAGGNPAELILEGNGVANIGAIGGAEIKFLPSGKVLINAPGRSPIVDTPENVARFIQGGN